MWNVSVVDMVRGMTTRGPSHAFRYFISNGRILRNNFTIFYGWISSRMNRKYIQFFLVINEYVCCICPTESQWHLKSAQMKHFGNVMTTKTRSAFVYDTLYIENPRMFHSLQEIGIFFCVKSIQSLTISIPFRTTNPNWKKNQHKMGDFVQINISNSMNECVSFEKKFTKDLTIADLKVKHKSELFAPTLGQSVLAIWCILFIKSIAVTFMLTHAWWWF